MKSKASTKQFLAMFITALFTIAKRLSTPKVLNSRMETNWHLLEQWNQPLKGRELVTCYDMARPSY
ncbi:hypothetical protein ACQP3J_31660, partial [Escherichia coli]